MQASAHLPTLRPSWKKSAAENSALIPTPCGAFFARITRLSRKPAIGLEFIQKSTIVTQMTALPAPLWNQIAATQELQTEAAKAAFLLDAEQLAEMENEWYRLETEAGTPRKVISSLMTALPLLSEMEAISNHLNRHPNLKSALPILTTPTEAASLMQTEWRLTDAEKTTLTTALSSPQSLQRWHKAALKASAMSLT
jgi:hypothetical protein